MLTLVTAPADLAEALLPSVCGHLRIIADFGSSPPDLPPDIDYLRTVTGAAVAMVDGPRGLIGRPLLTQSWKLTIDDFPPFIDLPLSPVQAIDAIRYLDASQVWQVLDADAYRLIGSQSWRPELCPAYSTSWPSTLQDRASVEIPFTCGYGDAVDDIPASILQAIRLLAAHFYLERQPVTFATPTELPMSVKGLLWPFRILG